MLITTRNLIDRCLRAFYGDYPSEEATLTPNLVLLYINDAVALAISKKMQENYVVTGIQSVPDGFVSTFKISSFTKDDNTGYYSASLPHPPMGFAENSSVSGAYFATVKGQSKPILEVKQNEVDYFRFMPHPKNAAYYWIEGNLIYVYVNTNLPVGASIYIRMASHITSSLDAPMNVPPDMVDFVFQTVMQRLLVQKNIVNDNVLDGKDK
jgi:hypothetical protein